MGISFSDRLFVKNDDNDTNSLPLTTLSKASVVKYSNTLKDFLIFCYRIKHTEIVEVPDMG
jgi:hypothetical protein